MKSLSRGFTLVELIVVITILAILATIGFFSFFGYQLSARDAVRVSDIQNLTKLVELYKLENGTFPPVSNSIDVSFSGSTIWQQGSFGEDSRRLAKRLSEVPVDPLTGNEYAYATTRSTGEYQIGAIVEKAGTITQTMLPHTYAASVLQAFATTMIKGNYNGKFITHIEDDSLYILGVPSILSNEITDVTLQEIHANNSFVYEGVSTAPATYSGSLLGQINWNMSPTNVSGDVNIIYSGSINDINTGSGKVDLISGIKDYYETTTVAGSEDYEIFSQIDPGTSPDDAIRLANTYITTGVGGLGNGNLALTEISTGESGGSSPSPAYAYCGASRQANNNNYGGFYNAYSYPNTGAYAALQSDGSIEAWGNGGDGGTGEPAGTGYTKISSTFEAFAALTADGSVEAWGNNSFGGNDALAPAGPGYTDIYATRTAFAALHSDGSIVDWGWFNGESPTSPTGSGFVHIASNNYAFAALHTDGSIEAWGHSAYGSTGAPAGDGYVNIYATERAFAALHTDGSIDVWGDNAYGGDDTEAPAGAGYTAVYSNIRSFAALASDGSIDTWGNDAYGGDDTAAPAGAGYTKIFPNFHAYAALASDGSIDTWGNASYGGNDALAPAGSGFSTVFAANQAFATLDSDGSIIAWGDSGYGGNSSAFTGTGYTKIFSNQRAFAALGPDGNIDVWGSGTWGGNDLTAPSGTGFVDIVSNATSFAALHSDGSIDAWGQTGEGGTGEPAGTGFVSISGGNTCQ